MTREEIITMLEQDAESFVNDLGLFLHEHLEADGELAGAQIPVFVLWLWNLEILNGGLCQFFVNAGEYASVIPAALASVEAENYLTLLCHFVDKHHIDLNDLSQFALDMADENDFSSFTAAAELYPFDEFDDAYYDLCSADPLEAHIASYIRSHIDAFATE